MSYIFKVLCLALIDGRENAIAGKENESKTESWPRKFIFDVHYLIRDGHKPRADSLEATLKG